MTKKLHNHNQLMSLLATDFFKALKMALENVRNAPSSHNELFFLGYIYNRKGNFENAIKCMEGVIKLKPDHHTAFNNLGYIYFQHENFDLAISNFSQAIKIDNTQISYHCLLALSYHRGGDVDEAIKIYLNALKITPNHPETLIYLLFAYKELGAHSSARQIALIIKNILKSDVNNHISSYIGEKLQVNDLNQWKDFDDKQKLTGLINRFRTEQEHTPLKNYPQTFTYPDEKDDFFNEAKKNPSKLWIIKPSDLYGGQHLKIINCYDELPETGSWVIQRYIDSPFLAVERKFGIRLYLLITSTNSTQMYLYNNAGVRFAPSKYSIEENDLADLTKHITQTELFRNNPELIQSVSKDLGTETPVWTLSRLLQYISDQGHNANTLSNRLKKLSADVAKLISYSGVLEQKLIHNTAFAYQPKILGLDVQVDSELNIHLLEIERYPGAAGRHNIDEENGTLSRMVLERIIAPYISENLIDTKISKEEFQSYENSISKEIKDNFELIF